MAPWPQYSYVCTFPPWVFTHIVRTDRRIKRDDPWEEKEKSEDDSALFTFSLFAHNNNSWENAGILLCWSFFHNEWWNEWERRQEEHDMWFIDIIGGRGEKMCLSIPMFLIWWIILLLWLLIMWRVGFSLGNIRFQIPQTGFKSVCGSFLHSHWVSYCLTSKQ